MTDVAPTLDVVHAIAGRARLRVPEKQGDDAFFLQLGHAIVALSMVREVRAVRNVGLREVMFDLIGQSFVAVLGFFSVRPEEEKKRRDRRTKIVPWSRPERRSGRDRRADS